MNKDQAMTWELLIILGIVVLLMSPIGTWLGSIIQEIVTHHNVNLSLNPFQQNTTMGANQPAGGGGGGGNTAVGHYVVNLAGGGQMNVNANSPSAAVENVKVEGGTPA